MTPESIDADVVHARLSAMRELLDDLDAAGEVTSERLGDDRLLRHAVEPILTQLVEIAASVNAHVASAVLSRGPSDDRSSFDLVRQAGFLSDALAGDPAPSAGLRNVLAHEYASIDLELVARGVEAARRDYRRYVSEVAEALRGR